MEEQRGAPESGSGDEEPIFQRVAEAAEEGSEQKRDVIQFATVKGSPCDWAGREQRGCRETVQTLSSGSTLGAGLGGSG